MTTRTAQLRRLGLLALLALLVAAWAGGRSLDVALDELVGAPGELLDPAVVDGGQLADPFAAEDAAGAGLAGAEPATAQGTAQADLVSVDAELDAARANVDYWGDRLAADPADLVAAVRLADAHTTIARLTGDVSGFDRALAAAETAVAIQPAYPPALAGRGTILLALHRFADARAAGEQILDLRPLDPTGLSIAGDAALELGDLRGARRSYQALALLDDGAAVQVRLARLAYVEGDVAEARAAATAALEAATDGESNAATLAGYRVAAGDLLASLGDHHAAADAYAAALDAAPALPGALAGEARLAAAEGQLDDAIAGLDAAIAAQPRPEWLARRADLLELRGDPGDARRAAADRATVEAIVSLSAASGPVYDRVLVRYLVDHGTDPDRALRLAQAEAAARPDAFGLDLLAWAQRRAGRLAEASETMERARSFGLRDAGVLYHAGIIALESGRVAEGRDLLAEALATDPSFDLRAAADARRILGGRP